MFNWFAFLEERMRLYLVLIVSFVTANLAISVADGAFVSQDGQMVEDFSGNSLDPTNWQQFKYASGSNPFSQNNGLTINCFTSSTDANYADYTSLLQTVAVGQRMNVDVTVNALNADTFHYEGYVFVYLTNNSAGTTHNTAWDTYSLSIESNDYYNVAQPMYSSNRFGFGMDFGMKFPSTNVTYQWEIDRLSDSSATWKILDSQGAVLGTYTGVVTGDSGHPFAPNSNPLYISLFDEGVSATFNHVVVSAIPEPATIGLFAVVPLLLCGRCRGPVSRT